LLFYFSAVQAVIGAGAAGLVSIRELLKEGHQVTGFEQGAKPGGVWVYDEATDSDLLGAQQGRRKVHGSMYRWVLVLVLV
jgi:cation diffusion facilitator CzcD-associated flavoprotein CzcO